MTKENVTAENEAQTARIEKLLGDTALLKGELPNGWTVSAALAHLAFWDRRASLLIKRFVEKGALPDDVDDDLLNDSLLEEWRELVPERAAALAVGAAKRIDASVSDLDGSQWSTMRSAGLGWLLERFTHRKEHLDEVDRAFGM